VVRRKEVGFMEMVVRKSGEGLASLRGNDWPIGHWALGSMQAQRLMYLLNNCWTTDENNAVTLCFTICGQMFE